MSADPAAPAKKNERVITCTNNKKPAKPVTLRVSTNANASAAAPVASVPAAPNAKAALKAEVDPIIAAIDAAVATVTKANLDAFNALLTRYRTAVPTATGVDNIPASTDEGALAGLVQAAVAAVKAFAPKAGGGRRKTHRKKHGKRSMRHSKRHCKTHKKHGGKRSTKHHKKHGKTRGKRSKHNKRSRKHRK